MGTSKSQTEGLAQRVFDVLVADREVLATRFLHDLEQRLQLPPNDVLPSETLLDHIPAVLQHLAEAARNADFSPLAAEIVKRDLEDLAKLRRSQGYGAEELSEELGLLEEVVFSHLEQQAERLSDFSATAALEVSGRLRRAIDAMRSHALHVYRKQATSDSQERTAILSDFGRAVTHELRNRVNGATLAVSAYRSLVEQGRTTSSDAQQVLSRLSGTLERIAKVVDDVFAVAVARSRDDPLHESRQPLSRVVEEAVEDMAATAAHAAVTLEVVPPIPECPVDPVHARLILINVVSNAIKYRRMQGSDSFVRIRTERMGVHSWRVSVQDNGIGIPKRRQREIFDRYVRGEHGATEGQGIGLAIASRAAMQLGGDIGVESQEGEGSTFWFTVVEPTPTTS